MKYYRLRRELHHLRQDGHPNIVSHHIPALANEKRCVTNREAKGSERHKRHQ